MTHLPGAANDTTALSGPRHFGIMRTTHRDCGAIQRVPPHRMRPNSVRWVYTHQSPRFKSEGHEDSAPAVRRKTVSDVSPSSSVTSERMSFELGPLNGDLTAIRCHSPANTPRPGLNGRDPFRLILPEVIAIGVRFSHASCTSSHSWRKAQ